MTTAVRLDGVSKRFQSRRQTTQALADVSLEIADGEFCCIVGPSGCGKSTLLRVIGGMSEYDGEVELMEPVGDRPRTATVFQDHGLFPWMKILDNVAFGLKAQGWSRARRHARAREFLGVVGLADYARAYPKELSGGMRQRAAIARTFASDPTILLMDEPLSSLDEQTKLTLQAQLTRIWEAHRKTVVYITHSIDEAILLADKVVILTPGPGRVQEIIDVAALFPRPRDVDAVRATKEFGELFQHIWGSLRQPGLQREEPA
ncbi:ABC transporter ATP-binding protein [Pimelobacter simplex]|uniref:ABC transporter ATP-binding protein n=1 Tax=Nocardioides simplex TaxID=2045 RepID=UPI003AAF2DD9